MKVSENFLYQQLIMFILFFVQPEGVLVKTAQIVTLDPVNKGKGEFTYTKVQRGCLVIGCFITH